MKSGVYKLYWDDCQWVYIGKSVEIETRYLNHITALKRNDHANKRFLKIYLEYGIPKGNYI